MDGGKVISNEYWQKRLFCWSQDLQRLNVRKRCDRLEHIWVRIVKNLLFLENSKPITSDFQNETKIPLVDSASAEKIGSIIREEKKEKRF